MKIKINIDELLFFILFFLISIKLYINSSTLAEFFTVGNYFNYIVLLILLYSIYIKFTNRIINRINIYYFIVIQLFIIVTILVTLSNKNYTLLFIPLLGLLSYNIDINKILKFFLIIKIPFILIVSGLSLFDIIENFGYVDINRGIRYSFGLIYATDFASSIFYITIAYIYVRYNNIKYIEYIILFFISLIVYYYTDARLSFYLTIISMIIFILYNTRFKKNFLFILKNKFNIYSYCIMFLTTFICSYFYNKNNYIYLWLNDFLTGRLYLANKGIMTEGISIFGKEIKMQGSGWSLTGYDSSIGYNFIDSSYIQWLLLNGPIFTIIILFILTKVNIYCSKIKDFLLLFIFLLISITGIVDHHILNISNNPFIFVIMSLFANSFDKEEIYD